MYAVDGALRVPALRRVTVAKRCLFRLPVRQGRRFAVRVAAVVDFDKLTLTDAEREAVERHKKRWQDLPEAEVLRRARIAAANKGKNSSWNTGKKLSPELRAKIASATKAAMQRADVRERMMQGVKVRLHSDETRQKISLAVKKAARRKKEEMGILDPNSEESKPKPKRKAVKATKTATAAAPEPQALPQAALSGAAALSQGEAGAPAPIGEAPRAGKTTRKATTARASRAKSEPRSAEGAGGVRKGLSEEHKRNIAETMRKRWKDSAFRNEIMQRMEMARARAEERVVKSGKQPSARHRSSTPASRAVHATVTRKERREQRNAEAAAERDLQTMQTGLLEKHLAMEREARERVARVEALVGGLKAKARTLRGQPAAQERIEEAVAKGETMLRVTRVKLEALAAEGSRLRAQVAAGGGSAKGDAGDVALVFSNGEGALVRGVGKERSGGAEAGAGESAGLEQMGDEGATVAEREGTSACAGAGGVEDDAEQFASDAVGDADASTSTSTSAPHAGELVRAGSIANGEGAWGAARDALEALAGPREAEESEPLHELKLQRALKVAAILRGQSMHARGMDGGAGAGLAEGAGAGAGRGRRSLAAVAAIPGRAGGAAGAAGVGSAGAGISPRRGRVAAAVAAPMAGAAAARPVKPLSGSAVGGEPDWLRAAFGGGEDRAGAGAGEEGGERAHGGARAGAEGADADALLAPWWGRGASQAESRTGVEASRGGERAAGAGVAGEESDSDSGSQSDSEWAVAKSRALPRLPRRRVTEGESAGIESAAMEAAPRGRRRAGARQESPVNADASTPAQSASASAHEPAPSSSLAGLRQRALAEAGVGVTVGEAVGEAVTGAVAVAEGAKRAVGRPRRKGTAASSPVVDASVSDSVTDSDSPVAASLAAEASPVTAAPTAETPVIDTPMMASPTPASPAVAASPVPATPVATPPVAESPVTAPAAPTEPRAALARRFGGRKLPRGPEMVAETGSVEARPTTYVPWLDGVTPAPAPAPAMASGVRARAGDGHNAGVVTGAVMGDAMGAVAGAVAGAGAARGAGAVGEVGAVAKAVAVADMAVPSTAAVAESSHVVKVSAVDVIADRGVTHARRLPRAAPTRTSEEASAATAAVSRVEGPTGSDNGVSDAGISGNDDSAAVASTPILKRMPRPKAGDKATTAAAAAAGADADAADAHADAHPDLVAAQQAAVPAKDDDRPTAPTAPASTHRGPGDDLFTPPTTPTTPRRLPRHPDPSQGTPGPSGAGPAPAGGAVEGRRRYSSARLGSQARLRRVAAAAAPAAERASALSASMELGAMEAVDAVGAVAGEVGSDAVGAGGGVAVAASEAERVAGDAGGVAVAAEAEGAAGVAVAAPTGTGVSEGLVVQRQATSPATSAARRARGGGSGLSRRVQELLRREEAKVEEEAKARAEVWASLGAAAPQVVRVDAPGHLDGMWRVAGQRARRVGREVRVGRRARGDDDGVLQ